MKLGTGFITEAMASGKMQAFTKGFTVLGMIMVGAMTAQFVTVKTTLVIPTGGATFDLQAMFDSILPGFVPLAVTMGCFFYLRKSKSKNSAMILLGIILACCVVCTLLGVTVERIAYRPLREAPSLAVLITAIGVSYLLQNVALLIFGSAPKSFTSVVSVPALTFAGGRLTISGETIVTIASCIVVMTALTLFINKTKAGQAMLAVSEDKGAAKLMGINVDATIALTFAIGSGLAAIAGVLLCSAYPTLNPYTGSMPGIKAFVAAVFGGIGSIPVSYTHLTLPTT